MSTETDKDCRLAPVLVREDREQIIGLTREMCASWNQGDAMAYGMVFTADCDYVAFDGTWLKGRDANIDHHRTLFETVLRGSQLVFEGEPQVRFLSEDVAVMHAMGSVMLPWQERVTARRRSIQTYVARRKVDGRWRFEVFHNTRYRPSRLPQGLALHVIIALMRLRGLFGRRRRGVLVGNPVEGPGLEASLR